MLPTVKGYPNKSSAMYRTSDVLSRAPMHFDIRIV